MADKISIAIIDDDITTKVNFDKVRKALPDFEITLFRSCSEFIESSKRGADFDMLSSDLAFFQFDKATISDVVESLIELPASRKKPEFFIHSKDNMALEMSADQIGKYTKEANSSLSVASYHPSEWEEIENGLSGESGGEAKTNVLRAALLEHRARNEPPVEQKKPSIAIVDDDITTKVNFDKVRKALPDFEITIFRSCSSFIDALNEGQDFDVISSDLHFNGVNKVHPENILATICDFPESRNQPKFLFHSKALDFARNRIVNAEGLVQSLGSSFAIGSYLSSVWEKLEHGLHGEPNEGLNEDQLRTALIELSEKSTEAVGNERLSIAICDDDITSYADIERIRADFPELDITTFRSWGVFIEAMNAGARFDVISSEFDLNKRGDEITELPQLVRWIADLPAEQQPSSFFAHSKNIMISRSSNKLQNEALDEMQGADFDDVNFPIEVYHTAAWENMGRFGRRQLSGNHDYHPLHKLLKTYVKEEPKPPAEEKKSYLWLMIDDEINNTAAMHDIKLSIGSDITLVVARSPEDAIVHLERWKKNGIVPDAIDVDLYINISEDGVAPEDTESLDGREVLKQVYSWLETNTPDFDASNHRFMLHSRQPNFNAGISEFEVKEYCSIEWMAIGTQVRRDNGEGFVPLVDFNSFAVRKLLNQNMEERKFPESTIEAKLKKSPYTTVKIGDAPILVEDEVIDQETAIAQLDIEDAKDYLRSHLDLRQFDDIDRNDIPEFEVSFGQDICGVAVFNEAGINRVLADGEIPILVMESFLPSDTWMLSKVGGVVLIGDGTEHLEVVVANHGITALTAPEIRSGFEYSANGYLNWKCGDYSFRIAEGDKVTCHVSRITGAENDFAGDLFKGEATIEEAAISNSGSIGQVFEWANRARLVHGGLGIQANVDTATQIEQAIELGLEGAGLTRTEHMFQDAKGLSTLHAVVLNGDDIRNFNEFGEHQYQAMLPMFEAANQAGNDFPLSVRLLDAPPSNEFYEPEQLARLEELHGIENTRGAQLATSITGLYRAQSEAIFRAANESGSTNELEITIPLIRTPDELRALKTEIEQAADKHGMKGQYKLRAMIETVSACEHSAEMATMVDGFSYGTNDLTQEVMNGIARNDLVATRDWMAENGHVGKSPQNRLAKPVEELIERSSSAARAANPNIDLCVCGQQVDGNDVGSISFCHKAGIQKISVPANTQSAYSAKLIAGREAINMSRDIGAEVEPAGAVIDLQ